MTVGDMLRAHKTQLGELARGLNEFSAHDSALAAQHAILAVDALLDKICEAGLEEAPVGEPFND